MPRSADIEAGPVVPEVRGRIEREVEKLLGRTLLRLGEDSGRGRGGGRHGGPLSSTLWSVGEEGFRV
jgi:hypothetical protein